MKKYLCFRLWATAAALLLSTTVPVSAQMFEDTVSSVPAATNQAPQASREKRFNNSWANPQQAPAVKSDTAKTSLPDGQGESQPNLSVDKTGAQAARQARQNAADELKKSLVGKRGTGAIRRVVKPGEQPVDEGSLIFLFYKDFKITKTMGGMVMCDVKFIVLHTFDHNLNNLSFRLKWPAIETTISYSDVQPNVETYFNYTLVGDGCYTMDKIPNVIVNRCRVKGVSQKECANKIRWLRK